MNHSYLCIDLKSYYASVECVDRGLDPFTANLVVADQARGMGALCLAVSPALKALGVRNRCRLFEIPRGIPYLIAPPRMQHYMDVSTEIYKIYLKFLAPEDIFPYSIDECFMDVTPYLAMYAKTPAEMAISLMNQVYQRMGICATAGVGTNLFLAKIAMDILAKHVPSHIGVLDERSFREIMWHHRPITDIWQIAGGTARRLAKIGVYDLYGITRSPRRRSTISSGKMPPLSSTMPGAGSPARCRISAPMRRSPARFPPDRSSLRTTPAKTPASFSMKWQRH